MNLKRHGKQLTNMSILAFIMIWTVVIGAMVLLTNENSPSVEAQDNFGNTEINSFTPTLLHFQGNTEETGCTGNGLADITACGGPFLRTDATLSTSPAASWFVPNPAGLASNTARSTTDPNWIWNLTSPVRLGGPMTVNWWASCGACGPTGNAEWTFRVWADGVLAFEKVMIPATPAAPNVPSLLSNTVFLPEINASTSIVLHIDPRFLDSQANTRIWYDSQSPCPGVTGSTPCDSTVSMPVLAAGEPIPTPTPIPDPTPGPTSTCEVPSFDNYQPPVGYPQRNNSGEPSIGINWNTGNVMTMSRLRGNRTTFDDSTSPADPNTTKWFSYAAPNIVTGLDPILFTDSVTGRTIGGELVAVGGATDGFVSDDDLSSPAPSFTTGGAVQGVDHQTIGGGLPKVDPSNPILVARQPLTSYPNLFYYASQQIAYGSVATSFDGGLTYGSAVTAYTLAQCGGLHGHLRVAPDGTVYLPNKNCGGKAAVVVSEDNGLNWSVRPIPSSTVGRNDPSVGIGAGGKVYVSYTASNKRPRVAVSDDRGLTWHDDVDLAPLVSPGITTAVFPAVVAGDNDRATVFFIATTSTNPGDPTGDDTTGIFAGTWYPYMAMTCNGGKSWTVVRADNDPLKEGVANPVQQGVVCTNGTTCPAGTRNLLDFNDLTVDSRGRAVATLADGCNFDHPCSGITDNSGTKAQNQGIARLTIIRQRGGSRLFSAFDAAGPAAPSLSPPVTFAKSGTGYNLSWGTPDDGGAKILKYRIYRGEKDGKESLIGETKGSVNKFADKTMSKNQAVYYKVTAVNKYGESPKTVKFSPQSE